MKRLIVITTDLCDMNCKFCLFYQNKAKRNSVSLKILNKVLDEAKSLGYELITLTGGEACLHPKFEEMVDMIVKKSFYFSIVSNGYEYKRYAALLRTYKKKFKRITFSLDSYKEEVHDKLRKKGSFKRIIEAIKLFTKEGIEVNVSICLNKFNYKNIEDYVNFLKKFKLKNIQFLSVTPTKKNKAFVLTDKERAECCEKINNLRSMVKTNLRIMSPLNTGPGINFCSAINLNALTINPKGELIFCCDINEKGAVLGSLEKEKLIDLIKKGHKISNYLKEKKKEHLYTHSLFEGFNTCFFCNEYLKKKIKV